MNYNNYHEQQIEELSHFYQEVSGKTDSDLSLKDAVIAWLTEGRGEKFRDEYLKKHTI